jgi:uncharacterized protein
MRVLTISDTQVPFLYSPAVKKQFWGVDLVISCGDLEYDYLEYILNSLEVPLFYVRGNHNRVLVENQAGLQQGPWGGVDLHRQVVNQNGLLLAGIEGSLRYRQGAAQYTQEEMWSMALKLAPALFINRMRYGRFLDVLVTHAPPWGIHNQEDLPHQGIKAFRWLIRTFKPAYHFHGHIHVYRPDMVTETRLGETLIVNTYGYRVMVLEPGNGNKG